MCIFDKSGEYRDSYICSEHITPCVSMNGCFSLITKMGNNHHTQTIIHMQ